MEVKRAMQDRTASAPGFSVRLEGASLFDLVQFECLDRERKLLRVTAGEKMGFLYFRDGNLVHASTPDHKGEAALRAMLGWERGQVAHTDGPWPVTENITSSWQSVLLRIAHAEDEAERTDNVVSFPGRDAAGAPPEAGMPDDPWADDGIRVAHISAAGDVKARAADHAIAETLAYAVELGDLLGDAFAIDRVASLEVWTSTQNLVLFRDTKSGDLRAAFGPKDVDTSELKVRLARENGR